MGLFFYLESFFKNKSFVDQGQGLRGSCAPCYDVLVLDMSDLCCLLY
jgi:hypothetical protein